MTALFFIFFIGYGIAALVIPDKIWYIEKGIWYKDSEPSDFALLMTRISGIVAIVVGLGMICMVMWG